MTSKDKVKGCRKEFIVDGWELKCQLPKGHKGPHCRSVLIPRTSPLGLAWDIRCGK